MKLSAIDTGTGMDAAMLARATEPFFTTKGVGKGTGLGLSMIYGLAERMGGTLCLHNEIGAGTRADLWLPAAAEPAQVPTPVAASVHVEDRLGRPLNILAVDDDPLILMNTAALLEDLGLHVHEASSGAEALEHLRRDPAIDLMITDQAMPNMTGAQLAEELRRTWGDLQIILASGYGELADGASGGMIKLSARPCSLRLWPGPWTRNGERQCLLRSLYAQKLTVSPRPF